MGRFKVILFLLCVSLILEVHISNANLAEREVISLNLEQVTRVALENNFDIQLAKYDAWISQENKKISKSIYDTVFDADLKYRKNKRKQPTTFFGSKTVENDYNVGLSKKLPTGTTVSVDMTNEREGTNSSFTTSPVVHDSTVEVTVVQELGKNFLGMQDRGDVKMTLLDIENSNYTSLEKIEDTIAQVQKAYWNLVLHTERITIEQDMVAQAKKLYDLHQEQIQDGLVELPDAIASEANYKKRLNQLTLVQNDFESATNVLKLMLNKTDQNISIEPNENFNLSEVNEDLNLALAKAFELRRDYKQAANLIKSKNINLTMKKNNIWPEVNLTASLARNGLGDHFDDSIETLSEENNPNFFAGLSFSVPLENRKARGELKQAEYEKAKILLNLKYLERKISIEIVDQVRNCNILQEVAYNSSQIAHLQNNKLTEEMKRFNRGRSETDTIIRFQEDAIQARWEAAQAKYMYYISLIDLRTKEASLLSKYWEGEL